jgi:hypothetical protein
VPERKRDDAGRTVTVQVWELVEADEEESQPFVVLHTLSNTVVVSEHEQRFIQWQSRTCKGWHGEVRTKCVLRGGLPPDVVDVGCRGVWSPSIHRTLPRQVRGEICAALMLFYRVLGRDMLKHVLFPFIAFRRGPLVRLFVSEELMTAVDGTVIWKEIAVLNARLPA